MSDDPSSVAALYASLFPAVYLRFHRRDGKDRSLSGAAQAVMLHLAQSGPLTVSECARHFDRAQSATSEIILQLEKKGFLARVRDANDRRRSLIWLSEVGRERLTEAREVLSRERLHAALAKMRPAERTMLIAATTALVNAADGGESGIGRGNGRSGAGRGDGRAEDAAKISSRSTSKQPKKPRSKS
jgi:DNA-binding MarR family transcriptional regulator